MHWLNRRALNLVLAATLALAGGALVGCGSSDTPDNNTGGTGGGTGGTGGGTGGTGGTGGEEPPTCGGKTCGDGELCNQSKNKCECTASPDSCEEFGMMCNANKICVQKPKPPREWGECTTVGTWSEDEKLVCIDNAGSKFWVRPCSTTADCVMGETVCDNFGDEGTPEFPGVCWWNRCGDSNKDQAGNLVNGANFGACDTETGETTPGSGTGTCTPFFGQDNTIFICVASGTNEVGEECKAGIDRNDAGNCVQGAVCPAFTFLDRTCTNDAGCDHSQKCVNKKCEMKTCTADAECGAGRYCTIEGDCGILSECSELCNAGSTGEAAGDFAGCTIETSNAVCVGADDAKARATNRGSCMATCDLVGDGNTSCEPLNGKDRHCAYAGAVAGNPLGGACGFIPENALAAGAQCGRDGDAECGTGTLCVGSPEAGFFCRDYCECSGAGGWTDQRVCKTSSEQCGDGTHCGYFGVANNAKLGVCIPDAPAP